MKKLTQIKFFLLLITSLPILVNANNIQLTQSETIEILAISVKKLIEEQKVLNERINILEGQKSGMIKLPDNEISVISGAETQKQKFKVDNSFIVYKPSANIRQEPNVTSPIKNILNSGIVFEGSFYDNDWVKMSKGYISKNTIQKIDNQNIKEYTLTHKTIMRSSPTIRNKNVVETLDAGKKVFIYDIKIMDNWYKTIGGAFFQK